VSTLQGVRKKGIGLLLAGRVMDKLGARRGLAESDACNRRRRSYSNAIMKIPLAITIPTIGLLLIPGAGAQEIARPSNRPAASTNTAPSPRGARAPAPSPGSLPGKGLGQHPFLYAGQWDTRNPMETMFLVRDGKVVWTHTIPDTRIQRRSIGSLADARNRAAAQAWTCASN